MLKKETSIKSEKIISFVFVLIIIERSFEGRNPPDEIKDIDKLNELKVLKSNILRIINIIIVSKEYNIKILKFCLKVSDILKDKKFVKDFFIFSSNISINKINENKKYKPPTHCEDDLHKIKLSSKCFILSNILKPVDVNPDIDSKYESKKEILYMLK
tara:strand:- start:608 stop:1081 length:474 start_codon:yes stop_codon:yes gene_type:complete